jgi:hypothetical protein
MKEQMKQSYVSQYAASTGQSRAEVEAGQGGQSYKWLWDAPSEDWEDADDGEDTGSRKPPPPPPPPGSESVGRKEANPVAYTIEGIASAVLNHAYTKVSHGGSSSSGNPPPPPPPTQTLATASRTDVEGEDIGSKAIEAQMQRHDERTDMAQRARQKVYSMAVDLGNSLGQTHDIIGQKMKDFAMNQFRSAADDARVFMNRQRDTTTREQREAIQQEQEFLREQERQYILRMKEEADQEKENKRREKEEAKAAKAATIAEAKELKRLELEALKEQKLVQAQKLREQKKDQKQTDLAMALRNDPYAPRAVFQFGSSAEAGSSSSGVIVPFFDPDVRARVTKSLTQVGTGVARQAKRYLDDRLGAGIV